MLKAKKKNPTTSLPVNREYSSFVRRRICGSDIPLAFSSKPPQGAPFSPPFFKEEYPENRGEVVCPFQEPVRLLTQGVLKRSAGGGGCRVSWLPNSDFVAECSVRHRLDKNCSKATFPVFRGVDNDF